MKRLAAGEKIQTKSALYGHVRDMLVLERLGARFPLVAAQLRARHENRAAFRVDDEHDLRDLLHALLLLEFDDVQPAAGAGFLLRVERIALVAMLTQGEDAAARVHAALRESLPRYRQQRDCQTLVYFVYDPAGYIENARQLERELSGERDGLAVRLIITPKGLAKMG